jgi:hypothetical protein
LELLVLQEKQRRKRQAQQERAQQEGLPVPSRLEIV